ncbi:J domain-containing protein [Natrarchaeobius chitinivorans]|uniref:J domain-containing protein n=1 Tax=Natrarchaeobius chitinivorans TaxID=1679083 RepID=A0A3N6P2F3_NATCH|nr:J domain-containing protein [Natrarchaeobius chitinivorans]RQG89345.1 J domain-containing protein [Natrarchaeobius chitinivorans]
MIDWPAEIERTPEGERTRNKNFKASLGSTTIDLSTEMGRLEPDNWRASIGNQHTKSNGLPRHNAKPDDPGFVLRWTKDGEQYAVACDAYDRLRDNVRAVYLWVRETRLRGNRPVRTAESEFAAARLPSADDVAATDQPHEVLDVDPDATESEVRNAFRERAKHSHPDLGGSVAEFKRITGAKEAMIDE